MKTDFIRTIEGLQRVVDYNLEARNYFKLPVFDGEPTLNNNPDEDGPIGMKDGELMIYSGGTWSSIGSGTFLKLDGSNANQDINIGSNNFSAEAISSTDGTSWGIDSGGNGTFKGYFTWNGTPHYQIILGGPDGGGSVLTTANSINVGHVIAGLHGGMVFNGQASHYYEDELAFITQGSEGENFVIHTDFNTAIDPDTYLAFGYGDYSTRRQDQLYYTASTRTLTWKGNKITTDDELAAYVPYTGATAALELGAQSLTANSISSTDGTSWSINADGSGYFDGTVTFGGNHISANNIYDVNTITTNIIEVAGSARIAELELNGDFLTNYNITLNGGPSKGINITNDGYIGFGGTPGTYFLSNDDTSGQLLLSKSGSEAIGFVLDSSTANIYKSVGGAFTGVKVAWTGDNVSEFTNDAGYLTSSYTGFDSRYEVLTNKGAANGYAPLNASTKVDAAYLPSYVSDIVTEDTFDDFPGTGTAGFIYIARDTEFEYRWNAGTSSYLQLVASPGTTDALAEGVTNLYYTASRFNSAFSGKSTTNLSEGSNLYYTDARVGTYGDAHYQAKEDQSLSTTDDVEFASIEITSLTASKLVFTDASKVLTNTGIGPSTSFVMADGSLNTSTYVTTGAGVGNAAEIVVAEFYDRGQTTSQNIGSLGTSASGMYRISGFISCDDMDEGSAVQCTVTFEDSYGTMQTITLASIAGEIDTPGFEGFCYVVGVAGSENTISVDVEVTGIVDYATTVAIELLF